MDNSDRLGSILGVIGITDIILFSQALKSGKSNHLNHVKIIQSRSCQDGKFIMDSYKTVMSGPS